jgi:catechol 2,3-dioxygenase-like lactoylglutathione lyase family enzyme
MLVRMDQHISFITLGVSDLASARRFYVDGLGWTPTLDVEGEVCFLQVAPGVLLALWPAVDLHADIGSGDPPGLASAAPVAFAHNVGSEPEVDGAIARVVAAGGTVRKPAQRAFFGGYHGYVADPDGFTWEIAHNPSLRVDADGTVHLGGD